MNHKGITYLSFAIFESRVQVASGLISAQLLDSLLWPVFDYLKMNCGVPCRWSYWLSYMTLSSYRTSILMFDSIEVMLALFGRCWGFSEYSFIKELLLKMFSLSFYFSNLAFIERSVLSMPGEPITPKLCSSSIFKSFNF